MDQSIECPECKTAFTFDRRLAGLAIQCPYCRARVTPSRAQHPKSASPGTSAQSASQQGQAPAERPAIPANSPDAGTQPLPSASAPRPNAPLSQPFPTSLPSQMPAAGQPPGFGDILKGMAVPANRPRSASTGAGGSSAASDPTDSLDDLFSGPVASPPAAASYAPVLPVAAGQPLPAGPKSDGKQKKPKQGTATEPTGEVILTLQSVIDFSFFLGWHLAIAGLVICLYSVTGGIKRTGAPLIGITLAVAGGAMLGFAYSMRQMRGPSA